MSDGQRLVRNVTQPTVTPFLPDPKIATGAAVIVLPGGGFKWLSMDNEGWPVAKWLADHGVAAFVVKYRLNPTPADEIAFAATIPSMLEAAANPAGPTLSEPRATQDALEALRWVRARAAHLKIDPARVGAIGFSAGAITALKTVLEGTAEQRPAFVGYIYGPMLPVAVPSNAPPLFAALAADDGLFGNQGFGIVESWEKAHRPVEFHRYEKGGHGFGMGSNGTTTTMLMDQYLLWLSARGILRPARAGDHP